MRNIRLQDLLDDVRSRLTDYNSGSYTVDGDYAEDWFQDPENKQEVLDNIVEIHERYKRSEINIKEFLELIQSIEIEWDVNPVKNYRSFRKKYDTFRDTLDMLDLRDYIVKSEDDKTLELKLKSLNVGSVIKINEKLYTLAEDNNFKSYKDMTTLHMSEVIKELVMLEVIIDYEAQPIIVINKDEFHKLKPGDHAFIDGDGYILNNVGHFNGFSCHKIKAIWDINKDFENHTVSVLGDLYNKLKER